MQAAETRLQALIEGTKQYVVPLFQRAYSWEKKEWEMLWNDLAELCETETSRTHFIGSMVTMPVPSGPEGVAKFLLIDGQQRITTIFILLTLLRDRAKSNGQEELAAEINDTLLINRFKKGLDYYKLQPTQVDRTAFQNIIHAKAEETHDKFYGAYQFFDKQIRRTGLDEQTLKQVITTNLSMVSIILGQEDDPYLVFESLNAKGRPLTQADLIRNYFFMKIPSHEQEAVYACYWKPMQEALKEDLTEYIRHYLMKDGIIVKQGDIYRVLKERILEGNPLKHLQALAQFSHYYQKILNPALEENSIVKRALSRVKQLEVTTSYPFLLNCYHDYTQKTISANEFVAILKVLENFIIRRFVCNVAVNGLNKIFPLLYGQIISKETTNFVSGLKSALQTKNYPKDTEFRERLLNAKLYGNGDRAIKTRLILEAIEESYENKERIDFAHISVEHIMPQKLTDSWKKSLGDDWETTHELLLHTLGNLTLTKYNSELSNNTFAEKREQLRESHLDINRYVTQQSTWTAEDIEERAEMLADVALSIWPYFGDIKMVQSEQRKVTGTKPRMMSILGQHFTVDTWRDVLIQTVDTIADLEPEKFESILAQFPRSVSKEKGKFRSPGTLSNGTYIETNRSAKDIQRFCVQVLESVELSSEDLIVETIA